jgi:uroporphyrinogen-III decarboxylase
MDNNCQHPIEAPPMGNVTLAEAKRRMGRKICLEGNIQIGDLYSCPEEEIERATVEAIRAAGEGGGFILAPTASPYSPTLPEVACRNYLTMIRTGMEYGEYPLRA